MGASSLIKETLQRGYECSVHSFEVERRFKNGFSYQAYYTLAKDIQDLENTESPEYAYDRAHERSA